jgi:hypothetical protein
MNKKAYQEPTMKVVKIQYTGVLMTSGDDVLNTLTNLDDEDSFDFGGSDESYTGDAR